MEGAVPALALLACPVGMGLMMWLMGRHGKGKGKEDGGDNAATAAALREEQRRIAAQIEGLEDDERREDNRMPTGS